MSNEHSDDTTSVIKSMWTVEDNSSTLESEQIPITFPRFTIISTPANAPRQSLPISNEGFVIVDKCCMRYVIPSNPVIHEWAGMFMLYSFVGFVLAFAYLLATMSASMSFRDEMSSHDSMQHLLPGFNSILVFGLLASISSFFAALVAGFAAHHASRQVNSALVVCSMLHMGLLLLSTLCLIAASVSAFVVKHIGLPISTINAVGMLLSSMFIFGIPIQIMFIVIEIWPMFLRPKINYILGKQPNARIWLC